MTCISSPFSVFEARNIRDAVATSRRLLVEVSWRRRCAKNTGIFSRAGMSSSLSHSESSQKPPSPTTPPASLQTVATEAAASTTTSLTLQGMRNCDNFPTQINLHFHYTLPRDRIHRGVWPVIHPSSQHSSHWRVMGFECRTFETGFGAMNTDTEFPIHIKQKSLYHPLPVMSVFPPSLASLPLLLFHFSLFFIRKSAIHSHPLPGYIPCRRVSCPSESRCYFALQSPHTHTLSICNPPRITETVEL